MMTKDEALKMAIDGLEIHQKDILDACKEALEQPTNMVTIPLDKLEDMQRRLKEQPKNTQPLDEVIEEFMKDPAMKQAMDKAREKLSPLISHPTPQTTQEHSMTKKCMRGTDDMMPWTHIIADFLEQGKDWDLKEVAEVLRNAQAKIDSLSKEWVSLSDYEIFKTEGLYCVEEEYIKQFARAIEAKLKEKNT